MRKKLTYSYVKEFVEKENYFLLSTEYTNANSHLLFKCDKGHEYKTTFSKFSIGQRCPICVRKRISESQKFTFDYVKRYIEKEEYVLLSEEYINNKSKLKVICNKGHEYEVSFSSFQQGHRCKKCTHTNEDRKLKIEYVKECIEKENYQLLSTEYKNVKQLLELKCPKGHLFEMRFNNFQQGQRCPICNSKKTSSKGEKEVLEYVQSFDYLLQEAVYAVKCPITGNSTAGDIYVAYGNDPKAADQSTTFANVYASYDIYFDFEDTATSFTDRSGNSKTGSWQGDCDSGQGYTGLGARFDGTGDYIDFAAAVDGGAADQTFAMWVYVDNFATKQTIVDFTPQSSGGYGMFLTATTLQYVVASGEAVYPSYSFSAKTWTHIAVTRDASEIKLYVNGSLEDTETISGSSYPDIESIGNAKPDTSSAAFNGIIDDFVFDTTAFTADQIKLMYYSSAKVVHAGDQGAGTSQFLDFAAEVDGPAFVSANEPIIQYGVLHANPVPYPPQCSVWFDGENVYSWYYSQNGTTTNQIQWRYSAMDDGWHRQGTIHTDTSMVSVTRGHQFGTWFRFPISYAAWYIHADNGTDACVLANAKANGTIGSDDTGWNTLSETESTADNLGVNVTYPNICVGADGREYISGTSATPRILFNRTDNVNSDVSGWETPAIVKSLSSANAISQLLPTNFTQNNRKLYILYSDSTSLFMKLYDNEANTFGSEETVTTDLGAFYNWRGVVLQDGTLFVVYRDSSGHLQYRTRSVAGAWGTETEIAADLTGAATTCYFTVTADLGKPAAAVIFYYDGTDISYKTYTSGTLGTKTEFVDTVTLYTDLLQSPIHATTKIPVQYVNDSNDIAYIKSLDITPVERSDSGVSVSVNANILNRQVGQNLSSANSTGRYLYISYNDHNHVIYGNVWDRVADVYLYDWAPVDIRQHDLHAAVSMIVGDDDYVYFVVGGRAFESSFTLKSFYPIGHVNFNPGGFFDLKSPSLYWGRGYKFIEVADDGVIYLILPGRKTEAVGAAGMMAFNICEYRNGKWSEWVEFVEIEYDVSANGLYLTDTTYDATTGRIHIAWQWRDETELPVAVTANTYQSHINYLQLAPQGDGTFKAYEADGTTEMTLPCTTTNTETIYNGSTGSYWPRIMAYLYLDENGYPVVSCQLHDKTTFAAAEYRFWRWDGDSWETGTYPTGYAMQVFTLDSDSVYYGDYFAVGIAEYTGIDEAVLYRSTDQGATWGDAQRLTESTSDVFSVFFDNDAVFFNYVNGMDSRELRFFETTTAAEFSSSAQIISNTF